MSEARKELIERLRELAGVGNSFGLDDVSKATKEAADLIESLRQQLDDSQKREVKLRDALWNIAHPIDAMKAKLLEGERLNGAMAVMLASDPSYLKGIAQEALAATEADPGGLSFTNENQNAA